MTSLSLTPYTFNSPALYGRRGSDLVTRLFGDLLAADPWDHQTGGLTYDEKEGLYHAALELPGFKRDEITVEASENQVLVTAESKTRGRVTQSFWVTDIDTARIQAKLEDGILTISLPKLPEALPKRIEVR